LALREGYGNEIFLLYSIDILILLNISRISHSLLILGNESNNDSCEQVIRKAKEYIKTNNKHHHIIQGISLSLSSLSMKEPLNPYNDPLITSNYNFEGLVERKCLLKNYKKPNISKWKKYWVAICEHLLFFHKQKSFLLTFHMRLNRQNNDISIKQSLSTKIDITLTETDRLYYRQNPSKCQSVTDCLIVLSQTKNRNEIQLSDLNKGKELYLFIRKK